MKLHTYAIEVEEEEDGRWSAVIPDLPGCNAWGYNRAEALEALLENATDLRRGGQPVPDGRRPCPRASQREGGGQRR